MTKSLNLLGMAKRAGKLTEGEEKVLKLVTEKKARIVFLANNGGSNTVKKMRDKTTYYNVPLIETYSIEELSQALGTTNRVVAAVSDVGFSKRLLELEKE